MIPIKIGIIGAGKNTKSIHIPNFRSIPGVEILEVANRGFDSGKLAVREFNIPIVKERWQDVATSESIDAVLIGTWLYLHCEATCMALKAGKHVLCEARMAMNIREAQQMLRTSQSHAHLVAQLVPSLFTLKVDKTVIDFLNQKKLGKILYFNFDYQSSLMALASPENKIHWRQNKKYSGVNTMTLGIAYESILRWIGAACWVRAIGKVFKNTGIDPDTGEKVPIEIPDYLSIQMEMKNGILGTFLISDVAKHAGLPKLEIFGEKGSLRYIFGIDGELSYAKDIEEDLHPVAILAENRYEWRVEKEFIQAIQGGKKTQYTTFETGLEYMKFTEAVIESTLKNGERIEI